MTRQEQYNQIVLNLGKLEEPEINKMLDEVYDIGPERFEIIKAGFIRAVPITEITDAEAAAHIQALGEEDEEDGSGA